MSHHTPSPTPHDATPPVADFVTLTDDELARVDGGFIQMLGALMNIAGPLISQFANKSQRSSRGPGSSGRSRGDGQSRQSQDDGGDQSQDPSQDSQSRDSQGSSGGGSPGGGFNLGSLLGMFGGGA